MRRIITNIFFILCVTGLSTVQSADKTLLFGMSGAFTGHFGMYGNLIKNGIVSAFKACNDAGGANGYTLELCAMEDESKAELTKKNIESMQREKNVSMFLGVMGTRGVLSVMPEIKQEKIAMLFPWGNDESFRDPKNTCIINGPGLMEPQIEAIADHIINKLMMRRVAIFHADDALSVDAVKRLTGLFESKSITPLAVAQYNRYTMDIETPAATVLAQDPRVVVCVGTSRPVTKLINYFFEKGLFGTMFVGIDSTFLVNRILDFKGVKFNYASTVPDVKNTAIPLVAEYHKSLKKYFPNDEPTELGLTYFACAKIIIHAVKECKDTVTIKSVVDAIEAMKDYDLQGFAVNFDASNRHAFGKKVWII